MATLGQTQYYTQNVNGNNSYIALPWGGNVPYSYTPISQQDYLGGLQNMLKTGSYQMNLPNADAVNAEISKINSQAGIYAPTYTSPGFEQFNPTGMPDQSNYTPAAATAEAKIPAAYGGTGANQSGQLPVAQSTIAPNPISNPSGAMAPMSTPTNPNPTPPFVAPTTTPPPTTAPVTQTVGDITGTPTAQIPTVALQPGASGQQVKALQDYLVSKGLMTSAQEATGPGIYGPQTTAAVAQLQKMLGVDNTGGVGYFGPKTIAALQGSGGNGGTNNTSSSQNTSTGGAGGGTNGGTSGTTEDPILTQTKKIMAQLGIPMPDASTKTPLQTLTDAYTQINAQLGLSDIKTQFNDLNKQYADLQNEKQGKISDIQDNPWMTQGVKDGNIKKINDSYATKEDNLTKRLTLTDNLYNQGLTQARDMATQVVNVTHYNQQYSQDAFNHIFDAVEKQATAAEWGSPYTSADGAVYQKNTTTGELRQVSAGRTTLLGGSGTVDPNQVTGWVQLIKSGGGKLSDIVGQPELKNAVAEALGASGTSGTNALLDTTKQSIQELQTMVDANKGFSGFGGAVGLNALISPVPGTDAQAFVNKLKQVTQDVVLPNLTLLHGLGRVTDREFQALQSAVTSLNRNLSPNDFKAELKDITDRINKITSNPVSTRPPVEYPKGSGTLYNVDDKGNMTPFK